ncbi:monodehydroascorbate reductase 5, chlorplastic-like [Camellia sinensis]|uniref:monodehydroascorbate reductase 5, chlorplastic-like n=1 Tax=Camellia sinensis TaxID=4442 RepID=UPI00103562EF|nr:monodehydroascorbate reductase 5, chlorplastic-like [Camellia sinensis]XP_028079709.1 monodehydroascorbate reductase 5, chlorplastic-like [Camellia sinensis]
MGIEVMEQENETKDVSFIDQTAQDVAYADSLISSLEKAQKVVVVGDGYIRMEIAAAAVGWKLDTTLCLCFIIVLLY